MEGDQPIQNGGLEEEWKCLTTLKAGYTEQHSRRGRNKKKEARRAKRVGGQDHDLRRTGNIRTTIEAKRRTKKERATGGNVHKAANR